MGDGPGEDRCPGPELRSTRGAQAGPTPGSRARSPRRAHQVAMPAPDKGPGLGSPAGATSWPDPSRRAQPGGEGETVAPNLLKLGGPRRAWKAPPYLCGHKGQIHGVAAAARARVLADRKSVV